MTEEEWLTSTDPAEMAGFIHRSASERKLRLVGCACCRCVQHRMYLPETLQALELTERFADDPSNYHVREELRTLGSTLLTYRRAMVEEEGTIRYAVAHVAQNPGNLREYAQYVVDVVRLLLQHPNLMRLTQFARVFRDVFGNPFRPVPLNPTWLTSTVMQLATGIYDERAFDRMPILADALQDAECDCDDILNHCRGSGPHVRGCWVIDLLLCKT